MVACDPCLRRARLVGGLSEQIERALEGAPSERARELLALDDDELTAAVAGAPSAGSGPGRTRAPAREAGELRDRVARAGCWARCRHDEGYPRALGDLPDPPRVLFGRGEPGLLARLGGAGAVTIVGARRPSAYGRRMAEAIAARVGTAGLVTVSGMALGIDSHAHEGALQAGGATVAVLGGGADRASPASLRSLYGRIAERGLVLSELPPGSRPRRWSFPARNRIMAALAGMTVVVEARGRSGSLITSSFAEQLGREVGAVPGRVGNAVAEGTNALLRDGAQLIRSGEDVLDSLLGPGAAPAAAPVRERLEPGLAEILDAVQRGAASQDALLREVGLAPSVALGGLARLELMGLVSVDSAGRCEPTPLPGGREAGRATRPG